MAGLVRLFRAPPQPSDDFPYKPLTPDELWSHLPALAAGIKQHLPRSEVEAVTAAALDGLLLCGPQGSGKTREAYEYARARATSFTGPVHCFVIRNPSLEVPLGLPPFEMHAAIVIFDDLQKYWDARGDEAIPGSSTGERVEQLIAYFEKHTANNCVAIATVREEWWDRMAADKHMTAALQRLRPHVHLPLTDGTPLERDYLCAVANARNFEVSDGVLANLAEAGDGSFQAPADFFRDIDTKKGPDDRAVSEQDATQLEDYCGDNWRQRVLKALPEAQQQAVELASILSACGVPLRRVYLHALHQERTRTGRLERHLYRWLGKRTLDRALDALARGPFPEEAGEFRPHGSRLDDADRPRLLEEAAEAGRALFALGAEREYPADLRTALAGLDQTLWSHDPQPLPMLIKLAEGRTALSLRNRCSACATLSREFVALPGPSEDAGEPWAATIGTLGIRYWELPTGDRAENLRRAIECYEATLRVFTQEDFPQERAATQNNLGEAWREMPTGDHAKNLRRAIKCYKKALRVYTEERSPQDWAMTQNNLGLAWQDLPTGDRAENLGRAIDCYEQALRVRTKEHLPQDWAATQNNLGIAWNEMPGGDAAQNQRNAIDCYEKALRVYTEQDFPQDWAMTQNNLGNARADLPAAAGAADGDRAENLRRAIECYEKALRVYTEEHFPQDWAMTQGNMALARRDLAALEDADANLAAAEEHVRNALRVFTAEAFPHDHEDAMGLLTEIEEARRGLGEGEAAAGDGE